MSGTPVCQITSAGIVRPDFAACLTYAQTAMRSIYGQDLYLGSDCQDGQLMALFANAIHDVNGEAVAAYNAFSPSTAQGAGLSSVVKLNGIRRRSATASTADVLIVGQAGASIVDGLIRDANGLLWSLPSPILIPDEGQLTVTATCQELGANAAPAGTLTSIASPTLGWQSVTNPDAAIPGLPIETDAVLRQRQAFSTALPSLSLLDGLLGAVMAIPGVTRLRSYENTSDVLDANGLPGHSIALVVEGGDAATIAAMIARKKGPTVGTYGSTVITTADANGVPRRIAFFRPTSVPISYAITVQNLGGYTLAVNAQIKAAIADWTNALRIGESVRRDEAFVPAKLSNGAGAKAYKITSFALARAGATPVPADAILAFNEVASCTPEAVQITVVSA